MAGVGASLKGPDKGAVGQAEAWVVAGAGRGLKGPDRVPLEGS